MKSGIIFYSLFAMLFITIPDTAYAKSDCFNYGYRYGLCATKSMNNIPCKPENDISIPTHCRDKLETQKGIKAGVKAVFDTLNVDSSGHSSSTQLDMINTSLSTLRTKLTGKTKSEVRSLAGRPNRVEYFAGKECWIYGDTHTSSDVGVVFDGGRVLTVTYY